MSFPAGQTPLRELAWRRYLAQGSPRNRNTAIRIPNVSGMLALGSAKAVLRALFARSSAKRDKEGGEPSSLHGVSHLSYIKGGGRPPALGEPPADLSARGGPARSRGVV